MVIGKPRYGPANADVAALVAPELVKAGVIGRASDLHSQLASSPWALQVCLGWPRRTHGLLDVWRRGTRMGAVRHLEARSGERRRFLCHLLDILRDEGFELAVSPLLTDRAARPFTRMGFGEIERLVVLKKDRLRSAPADRVCEIRSAQATDAQAIAAIDAACFDEVWRLRSSDITAMLPETTAFVAVRDSRTIGYNMVSISRGAGTVGRLAVTPECQRQGVGSALLAAGLSWLRDAGGTSVTLCTQRGNAASRRLYARFGFELLPDELTLMQKELVR